MQKTMLGQALIVCACAALVTAGSINKSQRDGESRLVTIDQGPVRGYKDGEIFTFYGIPYATAPTGTNKFRPPLPPPTWSDTLEATQDKIIICPQRLSILVPNSVMQEDCLVADVYVPDTQETNLPVVVIVHGGAYQMGSSSGYAPKNIVSSKKIIAVTFNYRLGAHGLLCLGTNDIPGNAGMKDQVALLRWVQRNIASFGGNPNDVTIYGWSAGASAADLLAISRMTRGLFHKVVADSGASISSFSVQVDPLATAKYLAQGLGFSNVDNVDALENFFKNVEISQLWSISVLLNKNSTFVYVPCVERYLGEEMFLDDYPANILRSGDYPKVPMLYGVAEMEGIFRVPFFPFWVGDLNTDFSQFLPQDLEFKNDLEKLLVTYKIKQYYFNNELISTKNILSFVDYFTDTMFSYGTATSVRLQVEAGNDQVYLYEYGFTHENQGNILFTDVRGASHIAMTTALLDENEEDNLPQEYQNMKAVVRDLFLNFVTTGKPVPDGSSYTAWPPLGLNLSPHMYLHETLELRGPLLGDRARFWNDIYSNYYRIPIPPQH